jgi:16S rRNA (cytosine967-C5)-methyltransferase
VTSAAARPGGRAGRRAGTDPRRAAYRILYRLDQGPLDLSAALDAALSEGEWDPRDRRLTTELAYGVARWRYRLDFALRAATGRRVKDLDRAARTLLRLGAYQLAFTDRIPAPAAVDETVRLAGRDPRLRGFVNGVLRRWAREGVPDWLARRWRAAHGPDGAEARARHANTPAPLTLRVETARTTPDALAQALRAAGLTVTPSRVLPDALRVAGDRAVAAFPGYREGWFYVQDEASQLVGRLVGARPGERVLDACAAPGGKTGQLAAAVGEAGEVVAVERDPGRIARLRDNLARLGLTRVKVVEGDAAELDDDALGAPFDRVLLDAPCTGLGVLGRHPEGKWWKTEDAVATCARGQARLLERLADRVAPGGHLVYAVCSGEPEETRERVAAFLAARPDFSILPAGRVLGALGAEWVAPDGALDTTGNGEGLDGFFAVHMLRGAC